MKSRLTVLNQIKAVCVFCGSSKGIKECYEEAAAAVGKEISKKNLSLVYGGGNIGLMRAVAQAALENGASITGIIPEKIARNVKPLEGVKTITVASMHERKALMYEMSDAFIALPGGPGTLEELIEVITWNQLGYHKKPVGILNTEKYYNHLISLFNQSVEEGFQKPGNMENLTIEENPQILIRELLKKELKYISKWGEK